MGCQLSVSGRLSGASGSCGRQMDWIFLCLTLNTIRLRQSEAPLPFVKVSRLVWEPKAHRFWWEIGPSTCSSHLFASKEDSREVALPCSFVLVESRCVSPQRRCLVLLAVPFFKINYTSNRNIELILPSSVYHFWWRLCYMILQKYHKEQLMGKFRFKKQALQYLNGLISWYFK